MPEHDEIAFSDANIAFVQGVLSQPLISEPDLDLLREKLGIQTSLAEQIATTNGRLGNLNLRLQKVRNELDEDKWYYVLQNTRPPRSEDTESGAVFSALTLSKGESLIFRDLLNRMYTDGLHDGVEVSKLPSHIRNSSLLQRLTEDGWITELPADRRYLVLTLRALLEIEPYLEQEYGDTVFKKCVGCRRHLLTGKRCDNCLARLHDRCFLSYFHLRQRGPQDMCPECDLGHFI